MLQWFFRLQQIVALRFYTEAGNAFVTIQEWLAPNDIHLASW